MDRSTSFARSTVIGSASSSARSSAGSPAPMRRLASANPNRTMRKHFCERASATTAGQSETKERIGRGPGGSAVFFPVDDIAVFVESNKSSGTVPMPVDEIDYGTGAPSQERQIG